MLSLRILLCAVIITALHESQSANLPFLHPVQIVSEDESKRAPAELVRVREGAPPPLCAGRCASPMGPVCAFDAAGTSRTFATLCELEAVSCHESTYYAITSLGEC